LNAVGLEVEGIEDPAQKLKGFRVAKILTAAQHPNADKLQVLTVDTGEGDPLQVVCGAPNARPVWSACWVCPVPSCLPMAWC
jgi:phenylalanyl-tRNA synthetase beta chain